MPGSFGSTVFPGIVVNSKVCVVFTGSKLVDREIGTWLVKGWGGFWFVVCLSLLGAGSHNPLLTHETHSSAARRHLPRVLPPQPPQLCCTFAISDPPPAGDHPLLKMRPSEGLIACLGEPSVTFWNEVSGISCDRSGQALSPWWQLGCRKPAEGYTEQSRYPRATKRCCVWCPPPGALLTLIGSRNSRPSGGLCKSLPGGA